MKGHKWQPEQIAWLKANRYELNNVEIVARFNQTFGLNLITHQLTNACKSRGFKHKNTGFTQGNKPWNTGLKGVNGKSSTTFKKGNHPFNTLPVGSERITKDGYLEVKVAEPRKWEAKHRLVWQAVNGPIAKGDLVIFIGDNKLDCSIENLQMVTRGELAVLNRHEKYSKQSPEIRMALINLVRLEQAAKRVP
jgi:hypothetical protein